MYRTLRCVQNLKICIENSMEIMLTDVRVWITIEEVLAYQGHIDLQGTKWFNILGRENILLCFQFNLLVFIFLFL